MIWYALRIASSTRPEPHAARTVGALAPLEWPDNIGTGDGRTPGGLGEGNFPP